MSTILGVVVVAVLFGLLIYVDKHADKWRHNLRSHVARLMRRSVD